LEAFLLGVAIAVIFLMLRSEPDIKQEMRSCKKCKKHTLHIKNAQKPGFFAYVFTFGLLLLRELVRDFSGFYDYKCSQCGTTNRKFFDFLND